MKTIQIEIPEGKRAEWVNGVLTLVDDKSVKLKFKVGDKIKIKRVNQVQTITDIALHNGIPVYKTNGNSTLTEEQIEPYTEPKDITERIKTFEDACKWCGENGRKDLNKQYMDGLKVYDGEALDVLAYLQLRIITCALNEGWEPTFEKGEERYTAYIFEDEKPEIDSTWSLTFCCDSAVKLAFKCEKLAFYAATQFKGIYMDFCYKGKE